MEPPYITLHTKDRDGFLDCDGYEGVTDSELEILLQLCREVALSLQAEIEKRQNISPDPPLGIRESCEKLHTGAKNVRILGRLDVRDDKLVKSAVEIMTTTQTIRASKVYQVFLQDILRHCGRALTLLCAASLGKQRVISLNGQDRTALVHYVKSSKAVLSSPALDLLAREYEIPSENNLQPDHFAERPGKRMRSEGSQESSNNPRNEAAEGPTKTTINTELEKYGDAFAVNIDDARYALSSDEDIGDIYLTNPKIEQNPENERSVKDKKSFLTAWISEEMGIYLGKRGRLLGY